MMYVDRFAECTLLEMEIDSVYSGTVQRSQSK